MQLEPANLSIKDAAAYCGWGRETMRLMVKAGKVDARKCGRRTVITMTSIKTMLAKLPKR